MNQNKNRLLGKLRPQVRNDERIETLKTEETGGKKYDEGKPRLDLVPGEALTELGRVLAYGADKYAPGNWANGINHSRLIAACFRHLSAYNSGEDTDPESGLSHVSHAMCNLAFLVWHIEHRKDLDDRWVKGIIK